jgi:hypothetical protein
MTRQETRDARFHFVSFLAALVVVAAAYAPLVKIAASIAG